MMNCAAKKFVFGSAVLIALASCHDVSAQYRGTRQVRRPRRNSIADQPALSPYLNLANPNVDPGLSYVGIAAPALRQQEINDRNTRSLQALRTRVQEDEIGAYAASGMPATGHQSRFRNLSHFYGGGEAGAGGGRATTPFKRRSGIGGAAGMGMGGMGMGGMGGMGIGGMGMGF
jgi:hypothetical protein